MVTEPPIKLGLLAPLTGIVESYGAEITKAAQIATDIVNEKGGILGRPLELIIADDGSVPETAVPAAKRLITKRGCKGIIGNLLSNSRISVAYQVAEPLKTPYLNFSFYEGSIASKYFFSFSALPNQQIDKMIPYMVRKVGPKVYFAGSDYEWPKGSIDAAKRALLKAGGEMLGEQYYAMGEANVEELIYAVARSGADIFVPYFAGSEQLSVLTAFSAANLKNKMAVVMGHYDEILASQLSPKVRENLYSSNSYFMSVETKENTEYLRRLAAQPDIDGIWPKGNGFLTNFGEGTFVCVLAYAEAVNKAGTLDTEIVLNTLKTISVKAPQGNVIMDTATQHAAVNCYLTRCEKDGSFEIIEDFGIEAPEIPERYRPTKTTEKKAPEGEGPQHLHAEEVAQFTGLIESSELTTAGFASALDAVDVSAVAIDKSGCIVQVNHMAETTFGYSRNEFLGLDISALIPPRFRAGHKGHVSNFVAGMSSSLPMGQRGEIYGYSKDGREFPAEASITKLVATDETYYVAMLREVSKYKQAEEELLWQASHDSLTALPNRTALMERLENALDRTSRSGGDVAVLFIDLDDFKLVNDSYGHSFGDQLLVILAERLLSAVRAGDTVARFGGDEFVVLCEELEDETAVGLLADRINTELRDVTFIDNIQLFPTCSIGVAISCGGDVSSKELLSNADAAMYQAKEQGRDGWVSFNKTIHTKARERLNVANGLRTAIAKDELHCQYQPIVCGETGDLEGIETLLRWTPGGQFVSPAVFIPVAEMTGTISELGAWVFEQACRTQVRMARRFGEADCPYVSVNVSPRQLEQHDFLDTIFQISAATMADSRKILIEVTETALMVDVDQNLRILKALSDAGYGIAIDDFGTGYSSLSLLARIPLTVLKVDRAFVSKLETSKTDLAVATAVIGLAHLLELTVVAEGVETEEQRKILLDLGARFCQGYYFAKPMKLEDFLSSSFVQKGSI